MQIESMAQRHSYILNKLNKEEVVKVSDLSDELNVSPVTIRKDLKVLESKKLLYRSHGIITKSNPYIMDVNVNIKSGIRTDQKKRIGEAAAALVAPEDAILIASGTTVLQLAEALAHNTTEHLTVVTSAMNVAMVLRERPNTEIIQLGGIIRQSSTSVVGPYAEDMLRRLSFKTLFLGVDGIDAEYGCSTSNMMEAQLNEVMINAAQKTVILTDSSKFGKKGFGKICDLSEIDQIITDDEITHASREKIEQAGVELTIV
ncbi:transcriptional regulator, DeoR family [Filimonas lacunae]|uniref:Transcriptional regulator, DeoR family n=1 Tax=Filimonas lacunae TaxID=477680 RepID=A0A1N7QEV8_9BACT|nr:DeoR/GlpR family DNA-binding transcription regulator [Filimonas lacunae]SIT21107.1 transcriptional regulator, DeoR family [Filimonas lacunae]